ncbi:sensor histidine kinase [Rhizobium sp. Root1204]|uniref:sensor histidine kinase n=1 Tax=Rhizobium sp. Root1204 TaxID=1736428 RepID=UPI0007158615|nr:sensor histidine kinase [Rhizobium sp. Root1204]KQV36442.1 histidine kinase [Rhizobium sp. Root1204]
MHPFIKGNHWKALSLAQQFLLVGGLVTLFATLIVGAFVTSLIEDAVTRNSGAATALYVDSVIAPLLPDMQASTDLSDSVKQALDETLGQGALGRRLMSFKLWRPDGTILYSNNRQHIGQKLPISDGLQTALTGIMVTEYDNIDDVGSESEREAGVPLLEVYNPVLQPWSGDVVAVLEFYEIATDFQHSLNRARLQSWIAVVAFTMTFFAILSLLVSRGSRTIDSQREALKERIQDLYDLLTQNGELSAKLQRASQRTTALNERYLRRLGAELHDGPAQLVALAALKVDSDLISNHRTSPKMREREIKSIKSSLDDAMQEIRTICSGLVLPQIEGADLGEIIERALKAHMQRTGTTVRLSMPPKSPPLSLSVKICVFRFLQEALNNGFRHGGAAGQYVVQTFDGQNLFITVGDSGPGFDPAKIEPSSLGLSGLRERVESLGGHFDLKTSNRGTVLRMSLNLRGMEPA